MTDMIFKTFRAEVRSVDEEAGIMDMLIPVSTESIDRDGEVIEVGAWKKTLPKFRKRPVLLSSHDYRDLRKQIGEFKQLKIAEQGLLGQPHYYIGEGNEEADWAFNLAKKGMAAFSVGFIPVDWVDGDGDKEPRRIYKEVELLEISQVVVPSNRDAIQGVRAKSTDPVVLELCDEVEKDLPDDTVTKSEETQNYIRIPVPEEEGKHEGHRIRTIDISKEKGIKALYCGECKVVITYLFSKEDKYGWTMESAREWVEEHSKDKAETYACECIECGYQVESDKHCQDIKCPKCGGAMRRAERPGPGKTSEFKGVISFQAAHPNGTPKDDEGAEWDAAKEIRQAEVDDLKVMCAWVDGENADNKTAYKLPHHRAGGEHRLVWRAVAASGAALMGARGGVDIPEKDIPEVKAHLARHYKEFDRTPPWEAKTITQEEIIDELDYVKSLLGHGLNEPASERSWEVVREIMRVTGGDIPDDIATKIGAVLNRKNRERLEQIKILAQQVLDSAENELEEPKQPEITIDKIAEIVEAQVVMAINKARGKLNY